MKLGTKAKPRDDTGGLPLLVDPDRTMKELSVGRSSLDELEKLGLLRRVKVGSLRVVRYRREDILALVDADPPDSGDAVEADPEATS